MEDEMPIKLDTAIVATWPVAGIGFLSGTREGGRDFFLGAIGGDCHGCGARFGGTFDGP
jgi:hypothetical protein